jgi:hypothetical protein
MIRKCDFFIKATLVCKENGNCLTYKNKKDLTKCKVFLNAPPIGESCSFNAMVIYLTIRKTMS